MPSMNTSPFSNSNPSRLPGLAISLGSFAGIAYVLVALNVLTVGNLNMTRAPMALVCAAALSYLAAGLLILPRDRRLLVAGAILNAMMMLFFFDLYQNHPSSITWSPGTATQAAQLLLEALLIGLLLAGWQSKRIKSRHEKQT
jgi:hypothetical protein